MSPVLPPQSTHRSDRAFRAFIAVVSLLALALLSWLLLFHGNLRGSDANLRFLPPLNAAFNGAATLLLVAGRVAIARRNALAHRYLMVGAFAVSVVFFVGYLAYHSVHGDTKFGGHGAIRALYLTVLISHVLLSTLIVPLVPAAFYFAWRGEFSRHALVTKILHPVWLYVSASGVLIYALLSPYYPA